MKDLTPRLAAVAALVRPGSRVADIGTDHAYLPVWLVKSGRCPSAIASDIGEGPATSARHTICEAELSHLIPVRVGDGLASIQPGEVEDIAIAGMGGETIAAILEAAPWVRQDRYRLVLQPMSKPERLRRFLMENGFFIESETIIAEGERLYSVMCVAFTNKTKTPTLAECIIGQIPHTAEGVAYLKKQGGRIVERLAGLPNTPEYADERVELAEAEVRLSAWLNDN